MNVKNVMSMAEIVESEDSYKDTELTFEHATGSILHMMFQVDAQVTRGCHVTSHPYRTNSGGQGALKLTKMHFQG